MVTILLTNYKRQNNLDIIISALRSQSIDVEIFLWNNAEEDFNDDRVDWIINSSRNVRCWSRWSMAPFARNKLVMTHDDDFFLRKNDAIELLVNDYESSFEPGMAMGFTGVRLGEDLSYYPNKMQKLLRQKAKIYRGAKHLYLPKENKTVDVIKGRLLLCKREEITSLPIYEEGAEVFDDIYVSAFLAKWSRGRHMLTNVLNDSVEELEGGDGQMALSQQQNWEDFRSSVSKKYFSVNG